VRRARERGLIDVRVQTCGRLRRTGIAPSMIALRGGEGMVMKPEPLFEAVESLLEHGVGGATELAAPGIEYAIVLLSAAGKRFRQETARRYAELERIILFAGATKRR